MLFSNPTWVHLLFFCLLLAALLFVILKYVSAYKYEALEDAKNMAKHPSRYKFYFLGLAFYLPLTEYILFIFKIRETELISNLIFGFISLVLFLLIEKVPWLKKNIYIVFLILFNGYTVLNLSMIAESTSPMLTISEFTMLIMFSFLVYLKTTEFITYNICIYIFLFLLHISGNLSIAELVLYSNVINLALVLNFAIYFINQRLFNNINLSHSIVNRGSLISFSTDTEGKIDYLSQNFYSILKLDRSRIVKGKPLSEIFQIDHTILNQLINGEKSIVQPIFEKTGEKKYFQIERLVFDKKQLFFTGTDITDSTNLKMALQVQHDRFKNILINTGDLVFVLNMNLIFTEVFNRNHEELLHHPSFYLEKHISEIGYSEQAYAKLQQAIENATASDSPTTIEYKIRLPKGLQWYEMKIYIIRGFKDEVFEYVFVSRNISERKEEQNKRLAIQKIIQKQNQVLIDFSLEKYEENYSMDAFYEKCISALAGMLEIDRVSIWLYNDRKLTCYKLFTNNKIIHSPSLNLLESAHPNYFNAIKNGLIILAENAATHPDTAEFNQDYFKAFNIKSLMDIPIRNHGELIAVICCEQTGQVKQWTSEDANFTKHMADLLSLELIENEQRKAEQELKHTKKILDQSNRIAQLGAWEFNIETSEIFWSDITKEILGLPKSYTPEHPICLDIIADSTAKDQVKMLFNRAIQFGKPFDLEVLMNLGSNAQQWIRIIAQVDVRGNTYVGVSGAYQNVHEQVLARMALIESQQFFKNINDTIEDVFWLYDIENEQVLYISPSCKKVLGYDEQAFYDTFDLWLKYTHPEDIEKLKAAYSRLSIDHYFEVEFRIIRDNEVKWMYEKSYAILDEKGDVRKNSGITIDISKSKEVEMQLQKNKDFESENKAKAAFLANMSHEIRTPLNGIIGLVDLLVKTDLDAKQSNYLNTVRDSANLLNEIINNILDFSKIDAGKFELNNSHVNLRELCESLRGIIHYQADHKGLKFNISIAKNVPIYVEIDETRFKQVLLNLLSNAIKFTNVGSISLNIEEWEEDHFRKIRFTIADTGIGIRDLNLKRIFEAFTQEDSSTTKKYGGTGLGLSITEKLLHLMGSSVQVKSEEGVGSKFYFDLDLNKFSNTDTSIEFNENQQMVAPLIERDESSKFRQLFSETHILIVEDNKVNMFLLKAILMDIIPSAHLHEAINGQIAIEFFNHQTPDLVFMDIQMPEKNGYEATAAIRLLPNGKSVPIIAVTAGTIEKEKMKFINAGMDDYLSKPITLHAVEQSIRKWLNSGSFESNVPEKIDFLDEHINIDTLKEAYRSNGLYLTTIFPHIKESLIDGITDLKNHFSNNDFKSISIVAHRIKGTALTAAFTKLTELTKELEYNTNFEDGQVKILIDKIDKEIQFLQEIL